MKLLQLNTRLSKSEFQSLKWITASLALVLLYQTYHSYASDRMMLIWDILIIFTGAFGCYSFLVRHPLKGYSRWAIWLILYFVLAGMMYGNSIMSGSNLSIVLEQDLRYVMLVLMGAIFASSSQMMSAFHWLMKWLAVISILFGVLGIVNFDFVASIIAERKGTWTMSYYYWWASTTCFSYWGYYFLFMKRQKILGCGVFLTYLALGALFVKRAVLVDGLVVLFCYFLFNKGNKIGTAFKVVIVAVFALSMVYFMSPRLFNTITDSYSTRIEAAQDAENLDRNEEASAYLENATTFQLILGNGIGHYPRIVGYREYDYQINAIHIGWANIIYKGGILYSLFYILIILQVIKKAFSSKLNSYEKVCLGVSISMLISLLYEGSWTYTMDPVCKFAPLFYLLSNNQDEFV